MNLHKRIYIKVSVTDGLWKLKSLIIFKRKDFDFIFNNYLKSLKEFKHQIFYNQMVETISYQSMYLNINFFFNSNHTNNFKKQINI